MSKYRAVPVEVDGYRFASKKEAKRYLELKESQALGTISNLELQPRYPLVVNGEKVGTYVADFRYTSCVGTVIVEDVKGMRTPVYRLKKRLMKALYAIDVLET